MARKKFGLEFAGFNEVLERYKKLGGNLKGITEECLEFIPAEINPNLQADMARHHSKRVVKSISTDKKVEWEGLKAGVKVGFEINKGGLPSIFLMYGTAKHVPKNQYGTPKRAGARMNGGITADKKLYNDVYGRSIHKKIGEKQEAILAKEIQKIMGG